MLIEDAIMTNDSFYPDISLLAVRNTMRIDGTVTQERLQHAIIEAIISVNHDLRAFQEKERFIAAPPPIFTNATQVMTAPMTA